MVAVKNLNAMSRNTTSLKATKKKAASRKGMKKEVASRRKITKLLTLAKTQRVMIGMDLITLSEEVEWVHVVDSRRRDAATVDDVATDLFGGNPAYARAAYRYLEETPLIFYHDDADGIAMLGFLKEILVDFCK